MSRPSSFANAMRSRGLARGLGVAPSDFDSARLTLPGLLRHQLTNAGITPATVMPAPALAWTIEPLGSSPVDSGWSPTPLGPMGDTGISTAGDRIANAQRGQSSSVDPGGPTPYEGPPVAHIPYGDEEPGVRDTDAQNGGTETARRKGWPWYIWVAIVVGGGVGVYALTRR